MPLFVVSTRNIYTTAENIPGMQRDKSECTRLGDLGQAAVVERLSTYGLDVVGTPQQHPFDVLGKGHDGMPVIGIEVKWLGPGVKYTRIDGRAIKRKRNWAAKNGLKAVYTAIVVDGTNIGWLDGLANKPTSVFHYDAKAFAHKLEEVGVRRIQDRKYGGQ